MPTVAHRRLRQLASDHVLPLFSYVCVPSASVRFSFSKSRPTPCLSHCEREKRPGGQSELRVNEAARLNPSTATTPATVSLSPVSNTSKEGNRATASSCCCTAQRHRPGQIQVNLTRTTNIASLSYVVTLIHWNRHACWHSAILAASSRHLVKDFGETTRGEGQQAKFSREGGKRKRKRAWSQGRRRLW